jgi:glycosyltransferase involved in cell wall biosynthesis
MKISAILFIKESHADEVTRVIESCQNQTYDKWELIIQESSSCTVNRFYDDNRVKWYAEPDSGPEDAIIKGWKKTTGDLVTWLGADDWFEPNAFEEANYNMKEVFNWPSAFCGQVNLWKEGKRVGLNGVYELPFKLFLNDFAHPATGATFFRKSAFDIPDIRNAEFSLWMQAYQTSRILWTDKVLGNYTLKDGQLSAKNAVARLQSRIPIMLDYGIAHRYISTIAEKIKFLDKKSC